MKSYNTSVEIIHNDDNTIMGSEVKVVLVFKYIAAILSLFGSFFIIFCYLYLTYLVKIKSKKKEEKKEDDISSDKNTNAENEYKDLKMGYGHNLIFYLAMSDFLLSISAFIKFDDFNSGIISSACVAQGVLINFSELCSICWTTIIAFSVYLSTKNNAINLIPKYYIFYFLYAIGIPLCFAISPLFSESYGPAGAWCWLNTKNHNNTPAWIWSLIIYIFIWVNIIFNIIAIIKSINFFKLRTFEIQEQDQNNDEANFLKNFCIVLKFFPIILVICWLPATINRIYLFASNVENTLLYSMQAFFSNLTGFLNCFVYSYYYKTLIKLFCCCGKTKEIKNEMEMSNISNPENSKHLATENSNSNSIHSNKEEVDIENENENVIKENEEKPNSLPEINLKIN